MLQIYIAIRNKKRHVQRGCFISVVQEILVCDEIIKVVIYKGLVIVLLLNEVGQNANFDISYCSAEENGLEHLHHKQIV